MLARANHPDAEVRYAVASSLAILEAEDPRTIDALIALSTDEDEDVRDWATFGLGWLLDANTPELREALFARVDDPHDDTRIEGIVGLVRRRDERARPYLMRELAKDDPYAILDGALEYLDTGQTDAPLWA